MLIFIWKVQKNRSSGPARPTSMNIVGAKVRHFCQTAMGCPGSCFIAPSDGSKGQKEKPEEGGGFRKERGEAAAGRSRRNKTMMKKINDMMMMIIYLL